MPSKVGEVENLKFSWKVDFKVFANTMCIEKKIAEITSECVFWIKFKFKLCDRSFLKPFYFDFFRATLELRLSPVAEGHVTRSIMP